MGLTLQNFNSLLENDNFIFILEKFQLTIVIFSYIHIKTVILFYYFEWEPTPWQLVAVTTVQHQY